MDFILQASRRHHSASGKSSATKISKQAAFAFVKRTLERCRQFEETGKSCFSESTFKNIIIAGLTQFEDNPTDKEDILSASSMISFFLYRTLNYVFKSRNSLLILIFLFFSTHGITTKLIIGIANDTEHGESCQFF